MLDVKFTIYDKRDEEIFVITVPVEYQNCHIRFLDGMARELLKMMGTKEFMIIDYEIV